MKKKWFVVLNIFIFSSVLFSQSNENSAPIKWEQYKSNENNITVLFPKLPVKLEFQSVCEEIEGEHFYSYADETVYQLRIFKKSKEKIPQFCPEKINFSRRSFSDFVEPLTGKAGFSDILSGDKRNNDFKKLLKITDNHKEIKWLVNDYKNFRWFEFTITTYKDKDIDENQFVNSLQKSAIVSAIEIGEGSSIVLGDKSATKNSNEKTTVEYSKENSVPLNIVTKPNPRYTDIAREKNTTGSVRVRVTFLSNGAIGAVTPINDLENGLTEQAVASAKKMAFLPQRQKDQKLAVTKVVVYTFSIY